MKLSINAAFHDKTPATKRAFGWGWTPLDPDAEQFAEFIKEGFAFSAQFEGGHRKSCNFIAADFLAVDFDGTMTLADALNDAFISRYATIIYTTASHGKDGKDRFRIVFQLPTTIENSSIWRAALTGLALRLGADMAATDGARLFFGAASSDPVILGGMLTDEIVDELVTEGHALRGAAKRDSVSAAIAGAHIQSRRAVPRVQDIMCADGSVKLLADIPYKTRVHCPFHNDSKPSAFVTESSKGSPGIYCSTCMQTFWIESTARKPYEYYEFEKDTISLAADLPPETDRTDRDWMFGAPLLASTPHIAKVFNTKYLPAIHQPTGVALIRSPKGSGKTHNIEAIVRQARLQGKSVLLIGHRRTLLRELSKRLGLACYLDDDERHFISPKSSKKALEDRARWSKARPDLYAISIDSLAARLPTPRPYDVVILDECEQVLSHVCSKTIEHPEPILKVLQHYITNAASLYMFDADLNAITTGFVRRCRAARKPQSLPDTVLQVVNIYQEENRTCHVYENSDDLLDDLLIDAKEGKRIFVACNRKRRAGGIEQWLKDKVPDIRTLLVTADDKDTGEVRGFLLNVRQEFLKYDVVVASPAIGTGIDITFPNNEQCVDAVYGFFDTQINTHYDIDQQIGRVRNPGTVKVWVSDEEEYFETDPAAIKLELVLTGKANEAITGFEDDGTIIFDVEHPLLNLQADSYAAIRASLNKLRYYFLEHKVHGGLTVTDVIKRSANDRPDPLGDAYDEVSQERINSIMSAGKIERARYYELTAAREMGEAIGITARFEVVRYEIEWFYGQAVTDALIMLDDGGRYRDQVERYEQLALHNEYGQIEYQLAQFWLNGNWIDAFSNKTDNLLDALFIASGLVGRDGLRVDAEITTSSLEPFVTLCHDRKDTLQIEHTIRLRRDFNRAPVKVLNQLLGLVGLAVEMKTFKKIKGKRVYYYQLAADRLDMVKAIVAQRKAAKADRSKDDVDKMSDRMRAKGKRTSFKTVNATMSANDTAGWDSDIDPDLLVGSIDPFA
jgi:hypothetical protein